ncbi:hypothetical protein [Aestuariivita sp.]|uniref:hypothetical protein n=1 Tax=Aestuariivita sp. TaxID=1872407 RepID=UPI002170A1B0|nr:hypothetical protein [Aestuariivita sp.]MCE8006424.1 hypothetical protein [Aestuariivita sp.]
MKADLPGFITDPNRNGSARYRVRVEGDKNCRITIAVEPDHPNFLDYYQAALAILLELQKDN